MGGSETGGPSPRTAASRSMPRSLVDHTKFPHPGSCSYPPGWPPALRVVSLPKPQSSAPGIRGPRLARGVPHSYAHARRIPDRSREHGIINNIGFLPSFPEM